MYKLLGDYDFRNLYLLKCVELTKIFKGTFSYILHFLVSLGNKKLGNQKINNSKVNISLIKSVYKKLDPLALNYL